DRQVLARQLRAGTIRGAAIDIGHAYRSAFARILERALPPNPASASSYQDDFAGQKTHRKWQVYPGRLRLARRIDRLLWRSASPGVVLLRLEQESRHLVEVALHRRTSRQTISFGDRHKNRTMLLQSLLSDALDLQCTVDPFLKQIPDKVESVYQNAVMRGLPDG